MRAIFALFGLVAAVPTPGGGPPDTPPELLAVLQQQADGQLPNGPPPAKLAPSSLTAFQLIAFNENFEVAFFTSLLANITGDVPGFTIDNSAKKTELQEILSTVSAQEELHAIDAVKVLQHFDAFTPSPCQYQFPTTELYPAIALADTFTEVVLGTLQDAAQLLAKNGDDGAVRAVASVIGQEGEQVGFYRYLQAKKPSSKPFLTTSLASYAFSALQSFVVPGSCPFPLSDIDLTIFPPLQGPGEVQPGDQDLTFSADIGEEHKDKRLFVTYLTGQNVPATVPAKSVRWEGGKVTLDAFFPFSKQGMQGLTIAALTNCADLTVDTLEAATLAAPALIQVADGITAQNWKNLK